jgi:hypothetical protein
MSSSLLCCDAASLNDDGVSLIDALPCDAELDAPGMRDAVNALILEEMEAMAAAGLADASVYLARAPAVPPVRAGALFGGGAGGAGAPLDFTRYGAPAEPTGAAAADPAAWEAAATRAALAVESLEARSVALELSSKYGADAWRMAVRDAAALAASAATAAAKSAARNAELEIARADAVRMAAPRLATLAKRLRDAEAGGTPLAEAVAGARAEAARRARVTL